MLLMFHYASAFDQDLGWCVDNDVYLDEAFSYSGCESTSCGVMRQGVDCPFPTPRPTVAPTSAPTATRGSDTVDAAYRLSGVSAALLVLALAA
jgi:hypothetical protein